MISFNWVIVLPDDLTAEQFDEWYLGIHTGYAKRAQGIVRYAINRAIAEQPPVARGKFYRVAQEWWEDWESVEECWNSHSGHALLGDGLVNMGLDPGTLPAIALTEDTQLEVASPARFSTVQRGYRSRDDGTITKLIAFGMASEPVDQLRDWYLGTFESLGEDERVGEHVFGTTVSKTVKVGLRSSLPNDDQDSYDWVLELWFDSNAIARDFLDSDGFGEMFSALGDRSTDVLAGLFRGQEMLVQNEALPHRDE